jgi:peptide/nickel transport system permease protein
MGGLGLLAFVAMAGLGPALWSLDPLQMGEHVFQSPSARHPLGTDDLGRDLLAGVVYGARLSLFVGFLAALISIALGSAVGALAGFGGPWADGVLMRCSDLFQVIPRFFLALAVVALFGSSIANLILVIGCTGWMTTARLVRIQFMSLRERDFVVAAHSLGATPARIVARYLLPNAIPPIVVDGAFQVAGAVLIEAGLSFLGLGDPQLMSWGRLLLNAQQFLRHAWWLALFPGISIFLMVMSINLLGDALNDALSEHYYRANRDVNSKSL